MLSLRTQLSFAQYLQLLGRDAVNLLFEKHGIPSHGLGYSEFVRPAFLDTIKECIASAEPDHLASLLDEIGRTQDDLRYPVSPKYRHDTRFEDLKRCLLIDCSINVWWYLSAHMFPGHPDLQMRSPSETQSHEKKM